MVQITIENDKLIQKVEGIDKLLAKKSRLEIPLAHVNSVRADSKAAHDWWSGMTLSGSLIPGVLKAGTFYQRGQRIFWDIHKPENGIVIELADEQYKELIVEVADPPTVRAQIQAVLGPILFTTNDVTLSDPTRQSVQAN